MPSWAPIDDPAAEGFPEVGAPAGVYVEFCFLRRGGAGRPLAERLLVGPISSCADGGADAAAGEDAARDDDECFPRISNATEQGGGKSDDESE